jgi:hypothetical protein
MPFPKRPDLDPASIGAKRNIMAGGAVEIRRKPRHVDDSLDALSAKSRIGARGHERNLFSS